jgi:hypothetical protein
LDTVTVCAGLVVLLVMVPNANDNGDTWSTGAEAAVPVPVRETVKGSGSADSEMVMDSSQRTDLRTTIRPMSGEPLLNMFGLV